MVEEQEEAKVWVLRLFLVVVELLQLALEVEMVSLHLVASLVQSPELWPEKAKFTEITQICCATRCMTCVLVLRSICVIHACSVNVSKKNCQVYQRKISKS